MFLSSLWNTQLPQTITINQGQSTMSSHKHLTSLSSHENHIPTHSGCLIDTLCSSLVFLWIFPLFVVVDLLYYQVPCDFNLLSWLLGFLCSFLWSYSPFLLTRRAISSPRWLHICTLCMVAVMWKWMAIPIVVGWASVYAERTKSESLKQNPF